jgi:hypothetical protein
MGYGGITEVNKKQKADVWGAVWRVGVGVGGMLRAARAPWGGGWGWGWGARTHARTRTRTCRLTPPNPLLRCCYCHCLAPTCIVTSHQPQPPATSQPGATGWGWNEIGERDSRRRERGAGSGELPGAGAARFPLAGPAPPAACRCCPPLLPAAAACRWCLRVRGPAHM